MTKEELSAMPLNQIMRYISKFTGSDICGGYPVDIRTHSELDWSGWRCWVTLTWYDENVHEVIEHEIQYIGEDMYEVLAWYFTELYPSYIMSM